MSQTHHYFDTCMGSSCPSGRCLGQCWGSSATAQPVLQVTSQRVCSYFGEEGSAELRKINNYAEIMFIYKDIYIFYNVIK